MSPPGRSDFSRKSATSWPREDQVFRTGIDDLAFHDRRIEHLGSTLLLSSARRLSRGESRECQRLRLVNDRIAPRTVNLDVAGVTGDARKPIAVDLQAKFQTETPAIGDGMLRWWNFCDGTILAPSLTGVSWTSLKIC